MDAGGGRWYLLGGACSEFHQSWCIGTEGRNIDADEPAYLFRLAVGEPGWVTSRGLGVTRTAAYVG